MKPFDRDAALAGQEVILRDGTKAKVVHYNPDALAGHMLLGYYDGVEAAAWCADGKSYEGVDSESDIICMATRKEKRVMWVNVYQDDCDDVGYKSKRTADYFARKGRVCCKRVEYEVEV